MLLQAQIPPFIKDRVFCWQRVEQVPLFGVASSGLSNSNIANPNATPLNTTTYIVIGTDANGCMNSDTLTITVIPDQNCTLLSRMPLPRIMMD
jgi:hypothetical protein